MMNKKVGKIVAGILSLTMVVCAFSACKDNNDKDNNNIHGDSENKVVSGEENIVLVDNNTYNNGGLYVQYKGNTYFREYSNADIKKGAIFAEYAYETENISTKYVNVIMPNGKIENLFEDDGYGEFYIVDDRFFLAGYNDKLYSVNMAGKDYIEFCKGTYVGCDEENHKIYYKNKNMNNALYVIDTESLKITKLSNDNLNISLISKDKLYYWKSVSKGIEIYSLNAKTQEVTKHSTIEINGADLNDYIVEDMKIYEDTIVASIGYNAGSMNNYSDSKLYAINLKEDAYQVLSKNVDRKLKIDENIVYFEYIEDFEMYNTSLYEADLKTLKVSKVIDSEELVSIEDENIIINQNGLVLLDVDLNKKVVVSERDMVNFVERNTQNSGNEKYFTKIKNVEAVGTKVYYLMELSLPNSEYAIGWRDGYERIVSEAYMYDMKSGKQTLLYLYKSTDKDVIEDEELHGSGDYEEPLAENEMYLEIKLSDKGLKEEFEVRVEEVGGLIIGKRVEYEGTHSRSEGTIKVKVTKEVGAMLTVYIDNKMDSQMLIED